MSQAKEHKSKNPKREIRLERVTGFQKNCTTGFLREETGYWEAHHILPVDCMKKRQEGYPNTPPKLKKYLEDCLWVTPWDINDGKNLIGLPTNKQHKEWEGKFPKNIPSHKVDHNTKRGYNDAVSQYLRDQVWNSLTAKDNVHDVDVAKLKNELEAASDAFREKLINYGTRKGGTELCWKNRFEADYKHKWYYPFSMALHPTHRSPGIDLQNLKNVFKKIKLRF